MKIRRFFAPDMRQAIRKVREEQGPDAVILSNRRVEGGVEIIAAVDYDEDVLSESLRGAEPAAVQAAPRDERILPPAAADATPAPVSQPFSDVTETAQRTASEPAPGQEPPARRPPEIEWSQDPVLAEMRREIRGLRGLLENQLSGIAWGEMGRRQPWRAELLRRLTMLGLNSALCRTLADEVAGSEDVDHAWRHCLALLARRVPVMDDEILTHGGIVALIGPTGVGKTTTVAKLAARFALRHGQRQVALITTDNYRIGAHEQLRTYAQILGVPIQVAADGDELRAAINSLYDKRLVLIDTAGMSQRDVRLTEQLAALGSGSPMVKNYLVLSAMAQSAVLDETIRAFRHVELRGCILTKTDEAASLGGALSAVIQHQLPLAYVGDGQRVPEDLQPARAHNLVARAVALMQQSGQVPEDESLALTFGGMAANVRL